MDKLRLPLGGKAGKGRLQMELTEDEELSLQRTAGNWPGSVS